MSQVKNERGSEIEVTEDITVQVGDGVTDFTLSSAYKPGSLRVILNGARVRLGIVEVTPTTFTMTPGTFTDDWLMVDFTLH